MDINKTLADLKSATNDEIAELWALLREDGNHLVDIVKHDLLDTNPRPDLADGPPGSTYPPAP